MPSVTSLQDFLNTRSTLTFIDFLERFSHEGDSFFFQADYEAQQGVLFKFADDFQVVMEQIVIFNELLERLSKEAHEEKFIFSETKNRAALNRRSLLIIADKVHPHFFQLEKAVKEQLLESLMDVEFLIEHYRECAIFLNFLEKNSLACVPTQNFYLSYIRERSNQPFFMMPSPPTLAWLSFLEGGLGADFFNLSTDKQIERFSILRIEEQFFGSDLYEIKRFITSFSSLIPKENFQLTLLSCCIGMIGVPQEFLNHLETVIGSRFFSLSKQDKEVAIRLANFDIAFLSKYGYAFFHFINEVPESSHHPYLQLVKHCLHREEEGMISLPQEFLTELTRQIPKEFSFIEDRARSAELLNALEFDLNFIIKYGYELSCFFNSMVKDKIRLPTTKMYLKSLMLMHPAHFSLKHEDALLNEVSKEFIQLLWQGLSKDFLSLHQDERVEKFLTFFSDVELMKKHAKAIQKAMATFQIENPVFEFFLKASAKMTTEELTDDHLSFLHEQLHPDFFYCEKEEQIRRFVSINWPADFLKTNQTFVSAILNEFSDALIASNAFLYLLKQLDLYNIDIAIVKLVAETLGEDFFVMTKAAQDERFAQCHIPIGIIEQHMVSCSYLSAVLSRHGFDVSNCFFLDDSEERQSVMQAVYSDERLVEDRSLLVQAKSNYEKDAALLRQLEQSCHVMQDKYIIPELGKVVYPVGEEELKIHYDLDTLAILDEQDDYILARNSADEIFLIQKRTCIVISKEHLDLYEQEKEIYHETGIRPNYVIDLHIQQRYFLENIAEFFNKSPDELNTNPQVIELAKRIGVDFFYLKRHELFERIKSVCLRNPQEFFNFFEELFKTVGRYFLEWALTQNEVDLLLQESAVFFLPLQEGANPSPSIFDDEPSLFDSPDNAFISPPTGFLVSPPECSSVLRLDEEIEIDADSESIDSSIEHWLSEKETIQEARTCFFSIPLEQSRHNQRYGCRN